MVADFSDFVAKAQDEIYAAKLTAANTKLRDEVAMRVAIAHANLEFPREEIIKRSFDFADIFMAERAKRMRGE